MAKRVAILGGTGAMGRWFAKYFQGKGFEVIISGRSVKKTALIAQELGVYAGRSNIEAVSNADFVMVATPIHLTIKTISEIVNHLKKDALLFDIASIKQGIIQTLEKAAKKGIHTLSLHPLFGPGATDIKGKKILVIPINQDIQAFKKITHFFKEDGGVVYVIESGKIHDIMMALTIALPYFLNIIFGKIVSNKDIKKMKMFGGTTFTLQFLLAETIFTQDPKLCWDLQSQNPAFIDLLNTLSQSMTKIASMINKKDKIAFVKCFKEIKYSLAKDPDFFSAYQTFYKVVEAIL